MKPADKTVAPHAVRINANITQIAVTLWVVAAGLTCSAETLEAAPQSSGGGAVKPRVYRSSVSPHWLANGQQFWYRNDLPNGKREFIFVDALNGTRQAAFDHDAVAKLINAEDSSRLPVDRLWFSPDGNGVALINPNKRWYLNRNTGELQDAPIEQGQTGLKPLERVRRSSRNGEETEITFDNRSKQVVEIFWIDNRGHRQSYGELAAGIRRRPQHTFGGHIWLASDKKGNVLAAFEATDTPDIAVITGKQETDALRKPSDNDLDRTARNGLLSPDGQWTASVREHNMHLQSADTDEAVSLSTDGTKERPYKVMSWSPDSSTLVAWRLKPGDRKEVHLLESSPRAGGRAILKSRPYSLPGDRFSEYELNVFSVDSRQQTKPSVEPFEHEWHRPQIHWLRDGKHFIWQQEDRGHQRFRVCRANTKTSVVETVLNEETDTFIWTTHNEMLGLKLINPLSQTDELIYVSERDGWRHLYLADAVSGDMKQITRGEYVIRGIDRIDEGKRQIWFRASGKNQGQDPYLLHFYRINFDGTGLVALTEGNGNHRVQFSPDRRFLIDRWSRVDAAPAIALRRVSDGSLICKLEEADIEELEFSNWRAPEVFVAKGRDGETDIWGIICRPAGFNPQQKYPVIENIYAGPHGAHVPKSFSSRRLFSSLTDRGFVVSQLDGMGTAFRSKAFHDVCWKNLKDAGFEDRILWHQAVAKKYPWYDISRMGIYGTSAGGQNAAGALLFHPEFYDAAVANCGCHDNRMDKASWNEQWMGYPVGSQYAESSNIDNAGKLQGKLFLVVGEGDTNVPPESTMRFVDALIKAKKDFELLVCPGENHGTRGPAGDYVERRKQDFFIRHLRGDALPDRNQTPVVAE